MNTEASGTSNDPTKRCQPCNLHLQGRCRSGAKCNFHHELRVQPQDSSSAAPPASNKNLNKSNVNARRPARSKRNNNLNTRVSNQPHTQSKSASKDDQFSSGVTSKTAPLSPAAVPVSLPATIPPKNQKPQNTRRKRPVQVCRAWKAGACPRGQNCRFRHSDEGTGESVEQKASIQQPEEDISRDQTNQELAQRIEDLARMEHQEKQARLDQQHAAHQARLARTVAKRERKGQAKIKKEQAARVAEQARIIDQAAREDEARQARIREELAASEVERIRLLEQRIREGQAYQAKHREERAAGEAERVRLMELRARQEEETRQAQIRVELAAREAERVRLVEERAREEARQAQIRVELAAREAERVRLVEERAREEEARQAQIQAELAAREAERVRIMEQQAREEEARQAQIQAELAAREAERVRIMEQQAREEEARQTRLREERAAREAKRVRLIEQRTREEEARKARIREEEAAREARRQAHIAEVAREEVAKTHQHVVLGSIVTFSAGLNIDNLITGFESCTVRIKNLPHNTRRDEVSAIFTQQGIDTGRFQIVDMKRVGDKLEGEIITDAESGQVLAVGLEGIDFRDQTLEFEVGAYNSPGSMCAATGQDIDVLTVSCRAPFTRYTVEYPDHIPANGKVQELNRRICAGRRVKVEINTPPPGRIKSSVHPNSIVINNLPSTVSETDVTGLAGPYPVKRLGGRGIYDIGTAMQLLRQDINQVVTRGSLVAFDEKVNNLDGNISVRARFTSWDEAHKAQLHLDGQRFPYIGNGLFWTRLQSPMHYTIVIPPEQYQAQRTQWVSLIASIKDRKACTLSIQEQGNIVRVRVSGSVKQATGALKVRVESLIAGEKVEGWHRSLGFAFIRSAYQETGAYIRADWRRQTLKVYGEPNAIERARELVKAELERLSEMEHSVLLKKQSVSFFARRGIAALKETFGEDNVKFDISSRRVTITGGEEAQHALSRLIDESLSEFHALPPASSIKDVCPVCYDDVSSPLQLGCGHIYCTSCMRHFLTSAADSDNFPLVCLGNESQCGTPIPIPTIQRFLPPASFNRLLEVSFMSYTAKRPGELKYCKTPDCSQIYRAAHDNKVAAALQCPSCFSTVCSSCHEEGHEGMTCDDYRISNNTAEQERLSEEWMMQQGGRVKKCPRCRTPIEKSEGCNHMTCSCGAHFCWWCTGLFGDVDIYEHMRTVHGGIYDNNPIPDPVNIQEQQDLLRQVELNREAERRAAQQRAEQQGLLRQVELNREAERRAVQQMRMDLQQEGQVERLARERVARERVERERVAAIERERIARWQRDRERERELERERERQRQQGGWGCTIM